MTAVAGDAGHERMDPTQCLHGALGSLCAEERARVVVTLPDSLPAVRAVAVQLERAILDILVNALEAGRNVVMHAAAEERTVKFLSRSAAPAPVEPGRYMVIEVKDDGPGVHPRIESSLFKTFSTTKGSGRGNGLAEVSRVMASHQGYVEIQSSGAGSTARLFLPLARANKVYGA
ncbi:MAG: ATP-binding protein [bacterium]